MIYFCFIIGSIIGSFLGVFFQRTSRHESIIFPRSHCDQCQHALYYRDLIPIISYINLNGQCRFCHSPISHFSWALEIEMAFLWLIAYSTFHSIVINILITILFYLSLEDIKYHSVPNILLYALIILSFITNFHPFYNLICTTFYFLLIFLNKKWSFIGEADIDVAFSILLLSSFSSLIITLLIASMLCMGCFLIFYKYNQEIPFIPFLSLAYLILICIQK